MARTEGAEIHKETSSRVSSIASHIMSLEKLDSTDEPTADDFNVLLDQAKTVAGSAMSQDVTPGQPSTGIHPAPTEFSEAQIAADPVLHFFHYAHLPPALAATSAAFAGLAYRIVNTLPRNAERSVALRKLLEAKDAAVRANLPAPTVRFDVAHGIPKSDPLDLNQPVEIGGHDVDRDGPVPFTS